MRSNQNGPWTIQSKYKGGEWEDIDEVGAGENDECQRLLGEYRMAFGTDFLIRAKYEGRGYTTTT